MKKLWSFLLRTLPLFAVLLAALIIAVGGWYWTTRTALPMQADRIEYQVQPGHSPRQVAQAMRQAGIAINEQTFMYVSRLAALDTQLKTGVYEARRGDTLWRLLQRMAHGQMVQRQITLVEGWTFQRILQALNAHPDIRPTIDQTLAHQNPDHLATALRTQLGITQGSGLEGWFYPDTYHFTPGTPDVDILRRAYQAQQAVLDELWTQRDPGLPLNTPYEALILASIVEKETGHAPDRERIAGVFINRLKQGMRLQTDPTVIYGMGDDYQGRIRRRDLTTDTPWNTYTRAGLPLTPIASSSRAALRAVLRPPSHRYLYFVARGDGTSEFSENLQAHNQAVQRFILRQEP